MTGRLLCDMQDRILRRVGRHVFLHEFYESRKTRKRIAKKIPKFIYANVSILLTFLFATFSLIVFRSENPNEALNVINRIFSHSGALFYDKPSTLIFMLSGIGIMMLYDLQEEYKLFKFSLLSNKNWVIQQVSYALLIIYILLAGVFDGGQFIYFAF